MEKTLEEVLGYENVNGIPYFTDFYQWLGGNMEFKKARELYNIFIKKNIFNILSNGK